MDGAAKELLQATRGGGACAVLTMAGRRHSVSSCVSGVRHLTVLSEVTINSIPFQPGCQTCHLLLLWARGPVPPSRWLSFGNIAFAGRSMVHLKQLKTVPWRTAESKNARPSIMCGGGDTGHQLRLQLFACIASLSAYQSKKALRCVMCNCYLMRPRGRKFALHTGLHSRVT